MTIGNIGVEDAIIKIQELFKDQFGLEISQGSLYNFNKEGAWLHVLSDNKTTKNIRAIQVNGRSKIFLQNKKLFDDVKKARSLAL